MQEWDFDTFDTTTVVDEDASAFRTVVENFEFTYDVPEDVTDGSSDDETADDMDHDEEYDNEADFTMNGQPEDCEEALLWFEEKERTFDDRWELMNER